MQISLSTWKQNEQISTEDEFIERLRTFVSDAVCPALCDEGCEVEPDGECEHGCPSVLLAAGLI
jgi:hypothetical protein